MNRRGFLVALLGLPAAVVAVGVPKPLPTFTTGGPVPDEIPVRLSDPHLSYLRRGEPILRPRPTPQTIEVVWRGRVIDRVVREASSQSPIRQAFR